MISKLGTKITSLALKASALPTGPSMSPVPESLLFFKVLHKLERKETLPNSFGDVRILILILKLGEKTEQERKKRKTTEQIKA